jgi:ADP-ribose pyrophosphatase YjhB (NUDIX family)
LKEPFFGYWSWPSGKINFGFNPKECAVRDLKEETDLVAHDIVLRAIEHIKTFDEGKLLHHHLIWLYETRIFSGTLKEKTHKARNTFMSYAEYKNAKRFPGDWILEKLWNTNDFFTVDGERHMKNGEFNDFKITGSSTFKNS